MDIDADEHPGDSHARLKTEMWAKEILKIDAAAALAFRDAAVPPPAGYKGLKFKLSRNYPKSVPKKCTECTWLDPNLKVNFAPALPAKPMPANAWQTGYWAEYINRIITYVREGQDDNLADNIGFRVNVKGKTRWFNIPWMAVDPTAGREFIHGTTNERTAHLSDLIGPAGSPKRGVHTLPGVSDACKTKYPHGFESWSVGFYNEWGGASIGKVIPPSGRPSLGSYMGTPMPDGLPFPEGTMVVKVLTSSAPEECVPFLKGAPKWTVDRHVMDPVKGYLCKREPQVNHIVQIDVAVVDNRNPNRWVYGTYVYDGNQRGATFWDRLVPLGLQWGSDPWTFPAVPRAESQPIQQTVLNPGVNIFEHYGCEKRLAGPVDNPASSCLSCHGSGYAAPKGQLSVMGTTIPPSFGFTGICSQYSLDNAAYFQNIPVPQAFPNGRFPNTLSMDTSLQLQVAYQQFAIFNTKTPNACTDPNQF
ncbi:MAG: hypothetical protein FJW30_10875 [Acidobacteria bacterium]|nr:hypothetical protein [Acidobacteriota bacterium]